MSGQNAQKPVFRVASASGDLGEDRQMGNFPKRTEVRVPTDLDQQVREAARHQGLTVSAFIRVALKAAVRNYPGPTVEDLMNFDNVRRDLGGAASNLNQIVRLAHQAMRHDASPPNTAQIQAAARELSALGRDITRVIRLWV